MSKFRSVEERKWWSSDLPEEQNFGGTATCLRMFWSRGILRFHDVLPAACPLLHSVNNRTEKNSQSACSSLAELLEDLRLTDPFLCLCGPIWRLVFAAFSSKVTSSHMMSCLVLSSDPLTMRFMFVVDWRPQVSRFTKSTVMSKKQFQLRIFYSFSQKCLKKLARFSSVSSDQSQSVSYRGSPAQTSHRICSFWTLDVLWRRIFRWLGG